MIVKPYSSQNMDDVIDLWNRCNLLRSWNDPKKDIKRKLKVNPELFLLGFIDNKLIATVVGGYDGHRGWINYLAVDPAYMQRGFGKQILEAVEEKIRALGCPKINIQVRTDNKDILKFYESNGYKMDKVVSMGKRLEED
jgi:ribosomal protein S18 acetylase RimI-like enzyme